MPKQSNQVRGEIQGEGTRVNREHDQFMNLINGRMGQPSSYDSVINRPSSSYDAAFRGMAEGGGLSDENRRRIRGNGGFDRYAEDGGYSEADRTNIRSRSNRTIPAFYDAMRDQFQNQSRISGASPSYSASLSRMGREQSRAASDQASDTEFDLMDRVNEGKQFGIAGMSGAESNLAGLESANKRFGIQGGAANELAGHGLTLDALRGRTGEEFGLYELLLNAMGQRGSLRGNNVSQRASYDPNVSWFDRLMRIWGMGQNSAGANSIQGALS